MSVSDVLTTADVDAFAHTNTAIITAADADIASVALAHINTAAVTAADTDVTSIALAHADTATITTAEATMRHDRVQGYIVIIIALVILFACIAGTLLGQFERDENYPVSTPTIEAPRHEKRVNVFFVWCA